MKRRVDYDHIAPGYDRRYCGDGMQDTAQVLQALARASHRGRTLEVGCGTGHFLGDLPIERPRLFGLDRSAGMLRRARQAQGSLNLVQGDAGSLPYAASSVDLGYCVNAIHHFDEPQAFIREAYRVLSCNGVLAIAGSDPRRQHHRWYLYDYFEGTYQTDLKRFPAWDRVSSWMSAAGFEEVDSRPVERIHQIREGRDVLSDPFLKQNSVSQLALLTEEVYAQGLRRIREAIKAAERDGQQCSFETDIRLHMLVGKKGRAG
ncbi:class I SAM-dependent methyltransferase [Chloroflexota bacterium]